MCFSFRKGLFYVCEPLERAGFVNAFGTRQCAASEPERLLSAIDAPAWTLHTMKQFHSNVRIHVEGHGVKGEGDALFTTKTEILLGIKTADCVPVLIGDPKTGVMAAVHAGWRGTLGRIVEKTMGDLREKFGVRTADCVAAIGPGACGDCYEVGPEVLESFRKEFRAVHNFMEPLPASGKARLNVSAANREQLLASGIQKEHIHMAPYCTMHQIDLFFSHRREGGPGRLLSVIGKKPKGPRGQN